MDLDDDGELMLRYVRGDLRAFETLYRRLRGGPYRYLARRTLNPESPVIRSPRRYDRLTVGCNSR